ncbi:MAG: NUDIX domain-containing protein [bacterium]
MINPDELLLCVDENNQPIAPVSREAAHRDHIWHQTVHILVMDPSHQQILCQERSLLKDSNPGMLECFFGGHVTADQSIETAVVSELNEELGIRTTLLGLKHIGIYKSAHTFEYQYRYLYNSPIEIGDIRFEKQEIQRIFWFPIAQLIDIVNRKDSMWSYPGGILEILQKFTQFEDKL